MKNQIQGVEVKKLIRHCDERGYFQEIIRITDPFFEEFGQWSLSLMVQNITKAWHCHDIQSDFWMVPFGIIKAVLYDTRPDSPTYEKINEFILGDHQPPVVLKIPPGVAHGCKVLQGPAMLMYITSHVYNPDDEGRIPHDALGYDWLKGAEIK